MRYWYDCEFLEDGRTIDLISIGIVAEDNRELYLVNEKAGDSSRKLYRRILHNSWLMQNVVPHLPLNEKSKVGRGGLSDAYFWFDSDSTAVVSLDYIRRAIREFIQPGPDHPGDIPDSVELWAWCGAYDHVALMQLFGTMMNKPSWLPSYTHDFQHLLDERGIRDDQLPIELDQHNALADARHLRFMMQHLDEIEGAYSQRGVIGCGKGAPHPSHDWGVSPGGPVSNRCPGVKRRMMVAPE